MSDPSKYLTLDFMIYLIRRLMDLGRDLEVNGILLDPKISVNLYPDLWNYYIEKQCQLG